MSEVDGAREIKSREYEGGTGVITETEARMVAARAVLEIMVRIKVGPGENSTTQDARLVAEELHKIELWLRREAFGGDKVAIRQIEKELGHQVRMRGMK